MNYLEKHIEHSTGMYSFFSWLCEQENRGYPYLIHNQTIYLHNHLSKYFAIGIGKNKKKENEMFFACQPIECEWLSLIKWKKMKINKEKQVLFLISEVVKGDEESIPDIPSFILAIHVDTKEKIDLIFDKKEISCREFFIDEYKNVKINFHKLIFKIPIDTSLSSQDEIIELFDYSKMLEQKEHESEIYSAKPMFIGDMAKIEGTDSLLKKWKENKI